MTTDEDPPPTVPSPPAPRRFMRSHDDRVLGGVAGGLGRAFGVDAIVFRIGLAALVFAGGVGLIAYAAALILVPADDGTGQPAPQSFPPRAAAAIGGGVLLLLAAVAAFGDSAFWVGDWLAPAALVVIVGYAMIRLRADKAVDRGLVVRLFVIGTVGLAVLAGAGLAFFGSAWATAAGGGVVVASVVLALGAALVVGALRGTARARWLAVPAIVIAFPAAVVSAADISLDGGLGERTYHPSGADRVPDGYRLGAGELVVDLRDLDWRDGRRVALALDVGVGHAVVLVPEAVCVGARSDIGAGYADVLGRDAGGVDVVHDARRTPTPGAPGLVLDVRMGMGAFEVLHRNAGDLGPGSRPRDFGERRDAAGRREARRLADRACAGGRA